MQGGNHWGGPLEVIDNDHNNGGRGEDWDRDRAALQSQSFNQNELDETQRSWLLGPAEGKKKKYVDLGCIIVSRKALKWSLFSILIAFCVIGLPIIVAKTRPKHHARPLPPDRYSDALHKALLFFNAQKSGKLGKSNNITWRGNSGLNDGNDTLAKGGLVGGYYDSGENSKSNFPMAYSMTMLSWSLVEYSHKYKAINEYDHVRDLIKWGTDYLLLTFNSSSTKITQIYSQVGGSQNGSQIPDDTTCWQKPEQMGYNRPTQTTFQGPDLAGEMSAALSAASIVFRDDAAYSAKLIKGAETLFAFARDSGRRARYSRDNAFLAAAYNSTGYYDEYMWAGAWLFYATGNTSYINLATLQGIPRNAKAFNVTAETSVPSWNNKLPAAMVLLTRVRMMLNPGYPYEEMLSTYQTLTALNMCSYLKQFRVYNWTRGGMMIMNKGQQQGQNLQYVANAAFLASLFADYLNSTGVPGFNCGPNYIPSALLRTFATSQMDYILGKNPMNMSYIVGYGTKFPRRVHHRGASIPSDNKYYSCKGGFKWRDNPGPNPHTIVGAMVGGPDRFDKFHDVRTNPNYTEPTLAGNAGLVAALASLTTSAGFGIDKNTIFSGIPPLGPKAPPPPLPWKP
ncbi:endoglucanase 7 [Cucurbita pepo subsp. pepo]|uniref:endoglucanase 7 n=1 Tax=Cucurbita pepo subsp. pepo TaxID=3664 RepID=UPI000C9D5D67|nr:endoglucanase 7 [Cucurbita pepo subsp. pepo]